MNCFLFPKVSYKKNLKCPSAKRCNPVAISQRLGQDHLKSAVWCSCGERDSSHFLHLNRHALLPACTCSGRARGRGRGLGRARCSVLMRAGAKPVWFQARISCQGVRFGSVVALGQMLADPRRGGVVACGRARLPGVVPREGCGILRCRVHRAWCAHGQMGPEGTQGRWQCCGSDGTTAGTRPASAQADVMRALC